MEKPENKAKVNLPDIWQVSIHDKALIRAVDKYGIPILSKLKNNEELNFKDTLVSKKKLMKRLEQICQYFNNHL